MEKKNGGVSGAKKIENVLEAFLFGSRWIQAPIYVGLILGSVVYSVKFFQELIHLFRDFGDLAESTILLGVLGLIEASMLVNLIVVVVIGGYSTFVSKFDLDNHEDKPAWLARINANTLKIKLIVSLVSISGVQLLEVFIDSSHMELRDIIVQIVIHLVFVLSALILVSAPMIKFRKSPVSKFRF